MAEYYPLLAKAVGSLPNSTSDTRRVVYERARKALIGQLRTLHPPVPDEDIEHESLELDRAIERLEAELAAGASSAVASATPAPAQPSAPVRASAPAKPFAAVQSPASAAAPPASPLPRAAGPAPAVAPPKPATRPPPRLPTASSGGLGPPEKSMPTLRTKLPTAKPLAPAGASSAPVAQDAAPVAPIVPVAAPTAFASSEAEPGTAKAAGAQTAAPAEANRLARGDNGAKPRIEGQRPIAPQPPIPKGPKRRMWIIPAGIFVVALVAVGAWKLRDRPQTVARVRPTEQTAADQGKIAERIGGAAAPSTGASTETSKPSSTSTSLTATAPNTAASAPASQPQAAPSATTPPAASAAAPADQQTAAANPDLPVAHRAALLVEAPEETNKVKTFLGNVVWKLNTVNDGPNDAASLAVEADIDLPDDKMKAVVTFEKNTDPSLPASHTIKIRFYVLPGSATGDVKQISVPQVRNEDSPSGESMAGVTVPVIQNSFLVGLSPGNAETANLQLLRGRQWIDIPMLLTSGKIAKLTFEKSDSGQRDLNEAITAWQKS